MRTTRPARKSHQLPRQFYGAVFEKKQVAYRRRECALALSKRPEIGGMVTAVFQDRSQQI